MSPLELREDEIYTNKGVEIVNNPEKLLLTICNSCDFELFNKLESYHNVVKELVILFKINDIFGDIPTLMSYPRLDNYFKYLGSLKSLCDLHLLGMPIDGDGIGFLSGLSNLEHINIQNCTIKDGIFSYFYVLPQLRTLNIGNSANIPSCLKKSDLTQLGKNDELRVISITCSQLHDESFSDFHGLPLLENMDVQGNNLTCENFQFLSNCPKLNSLRISNNPISNRGIAVMAKNVRSNLNALELNDCPNADDEWIENLSKMKHVKCLYLNNGNITDKSLSLFQNMQWLEFLSLEGCPISVKACKAIHEACDKLTICLPNGHSLDSKKQKRIAKHYS